MSTDLPDDISLEAFLSILERYPATLSAVSGSKASKQNNALADNKTLEQLDTWKDTLADSVPKRKAKDGDRFLTKQELQEIVRWKLKRGVFRPSLPGLVASNSEDLVHSSTKAAFKDIDNRSSSSKPDQAYVNSILKKLTILKGVGPATATAILAAVYPESFPFFSDEAFRWIMWSNSGKKGGGIGWQRKLDYNAKEYLEYIESVWDLLERLQSEARQQQKKAATSITAKEVERVGWVLGQEEKLGGPLSAKSTIPENKNTDAKETKRVDSKSSEKVETKTKASNEEESKKRGGEAVEVRRSKRNKP